MTQVECSPAGDRLTGCSGAENGGPIGHLDKGAGDPWRRGLGLPLTQLLISVLVP